MMSPQSLAVARSLHRRSHSWVCMWLILVWMRCSCEVRSARRARTEARVREAVVRVCFDSVMRSWRVCRVCRRSRVVVCRVWRDVRGS